MSSSLPQTLTPTYQALLEQLKDAHAPTPIVPLNTTLIIAIFLAALVAFLLLVLAWKFWKKKRIWVDECKRIQKTFALEEDITQTLQEANQLLRHVLYINAVHANHLTGQAWLDALNSMVDKNMFDSEWVDFLYQTKHHQYNDQNYHKTCLFLELCGAWLKRYKPKRKKA